MEPQEAVPHLAWRWLGLSIVILFLAIVIVIVLISAGTFDPKPIGELLSTYPLELASVAAEDRELIWLKQPPTTGSMTYRLLANRLDGELDIGYGLVTGEEKNYVVVAVSPLGYLTIWRGETVDGQPTNVEKIVLWQTWPHVRLNEEDNEIWVDIIEGQITTVRINRELLWRGALPLAGVKVGLWTESFGQPAEINFQQLEFFTETTE